MIAARIWFARGDLEEAKGALSELSMLPVNTSELPRYIADAARIGAAIDRDLVERLLSGAEGKTGMTERAVVSARAVVAEGAGDLGEAEAGFARAAEGWRLFGVPYEEAQALLGRGRCLTSLGRTSEAGGPLELAREIFERLGAAPAMAETDSLLGTAFEQTS